MQVKPVKSMVSGRQPGLTCQHGNLDTQPQMFHWKKKQKKFSGRKRLLSKSFRFALGTHDGSLQFQRINKTDGGAKQLKLPPKFLVPVMPSFNMVVNFYTIIGEYVVVCP